MNFLSQYPWVKWILIGFGVIYILDKYFGFSLIDKLRNRDRKYRFMMFSHLNDTQLKQLITEFNQKQLDKVEFLLKNMNLNYRSFAFKCLGQYGNIEVTNEWIQNEDKNVLPKIIKGYQLIDKAWKIRGRGSIDTVSKKDLNSFKIYLKQAEVLFQEANQESSEFESNIVGSLLKIYKAIDVDREKIHALFNKAQKTNPSDAELNFNYHSFISEKWGGTEKEMNDYLNTLEDRSPFIQNLIQAQYYFDLVNIAGYKDENGMIKNFISTMKNKPIDDEELYRYELYLLLYWISNNLELTDLEDHYKQKIEPYWED